MGRFPRRVNPARFQTETLPNGLKLLETLYERPIFTVASVAALLDVSSQAANTLTDRLLRLGIVNEITGRKRDRVFRYDPHVALFTD